MMLRSSKSKMRSKDKLKLRFSSRSMRRIPSQARSSKISMPSKPSPSFPLPAGEGQGGGKQSFIASGKPMREITFARSSNEARAEEMRADPNVFMSGRDGAATGTRLKRRYRLGQERAE